MDDKNSMGEIELIKPELAAELRALLTQHSQESEVSAVATWVCSKMSTAINVRAPYTKKLQSATYALRQEYPPEELSKLTDSGQVNVHMGISATKMTTVAAWLKDIYAGDARVWSLTSTPIPSMPGEVHQMVMQRVMDETMTLGLQPEDVQALMSQLNAVALTHLKAAAATGVLAMEEYIDDRLTECYFQDEMAKFIDDFATYPYAVMGGPFLVTQKKLVWDGAQAVTADVPTLVAKRVNPIHFYWSADAINCNDGEYVIEYADIDAASLYACRNMEGFIQPSIDAVMADAYEFSSVAYGADHTHLEALQKATYQTLGGNQRYPVIKYFGRIPAAYLSNHGIAVEDVTKPVEVECWVLGNHVIRLVDNPYPCGRRPYHLTSYNKVPGAMVGRGLHDILQGVERVANAAARNIVKNMAFSAGPIAEVDEARLAEGDSKMVSVQPFKVYRVTESLLGDGKQAIRFQVIPSVAAELSGVYDKFSAEADRISGLHPLLLGQVDMASSSRTASGLSMLISNASKVIKATLGNIDRDVVTSVVRGFYEWIMVYDTAFDQKSDAQVIAKGSGHALQRDMQQAKVLELLQVIAPYAQAGMVPPGTVIHLLREIVSGAGYDANTMLPSVDSSMMQIQNIMAGQAGGSPGKAPPPSVPQGLASLPQGDGRFVQSPV